MKRAAECADHVQEVDSKFHDFKTDAGMKISALIKDSDYLKKEFGDLKFKFENYTDKNDENMRQILTRLDNLSSKFNNMEINVGDKVEGLEETLTRDYRRELSKPCNSHLVYS